MEFNVEILPASPILSPYIEYFKLITGTIHGRFKVVPFFNQEIYFHLKHGNYCLMSPGRYEIKDPIIHLGGLHEVDQDIYSIIPENEKVKSFVIVFKPNGIQKLFRLSNNEIQKHAINGSDLFKTDADIILEKLFDASNTMEMKIRIERYLSTFISDCTTDSLMNTIADCIKVHNGIYGVQKIAERFHITPRTFQRRFKDEFGLSPKNYMQLIRINYAVSRLSSGKYDSLKDLAYYSGYYDQSHFIRDIKRICGTLPGIMENKKALIQCHNISFTDIT